MLLGPENAKHDELCLEAKAVGQVLSGKVLSHPLKDIFAAVRMKYRQLLIKNADALGGSAWWLHLLLQV